MLTEGHLAPNFSLPASDGTIFNLYERAKSNIIILSFYPKNHLFACPSKKVYEQARSLIDSYEQIKISGGELYGISVDSLKSHKNFIQEFNIPFTLLSDTEKQVCKQYAGLNIYGLAKRTIIVVDRSCKISKIIRDIDSKSIGKQLVSLLNGVKSN